jgi:DNA-binding SARP family transcriptional activator
MRYEILGPLRVIEHGISHFIGPQKVEIVLATLLIRSGQVVTLDQLIAETWNGKAPRQAVAAIHVYISQLRKFLDRPHRAANPVVTHPSGYLLDMGDDEFDLHSFEQLVQRGMTFARSGHPEKAIGPLSSALDLWRGPVLDRFRPGPIVEGLVAWLNEERLGCVETLVNVRLALGQHRELVGELYALTAEYPLREAFYRLLMLALYRSHRQADALRVYHTARNTLHSELGLEPCRSLQELQRAILLGDAGLDLRACLET